MANAIAIMHTWPDVRNAEYEVLQRLIAAAENIGQSVAVIDNNGQVLWASEGLSLKIGMQLPNKAVRYIISLHFESPRVLDIYSYYALWQPIEFYYDFGYNVSIDKFSTHNDLLSCDSDLADAHALNLFGGYGRQPKEPLVRLFHSPALPYFEPNVTEHSKLFYIGINWERIGRPKGRFHDTLVSLDQQGMTSIYGPQKILGVAPWEGFLTYQGELPFDGRSVMRAINRAGICLALSSAQHRATGIMSNRLFEGFAGGAAVIATPNTIIDKHFRDCVYIVDDTRGEEILGQMIVEAVRDIRSNSQEATARAREGQRILRDVCSLEGSLQALSDNHAARVTHFEQKCLSNSAAVTVILLDNFGSIALARERLKDYVAQRRCIIDLHLVCDGVMADQLRNDFPLGGGVRSLTVHGCGFEPRANRFDGVKQSAARSGPIIHRILENASTPYFSITGMSDIIFSDHLASLAKALEDRKSASFAASGLIIQTRDVSGQMRRTLGAIRCVEFDTLLLANGSLQGGRFMFRTSLATANFKNLMTLLDGEEIRLFKLAGLLDGELAQTSYASMVSDETIALSPRPVAEPPAVQQQYIRDRFQQDPRWLDRLARGTKLPEFVYAYAPGAPVRWQDFTLPVASRPKIPFDEMIAICEGAPGLAYLGAGFSTPETSHVWLASERGIIEFALDAADPAVATDCAIVLLVSGRRSMETGREQHCTIALNGAVIAYVAVPDYEHEMRIAIPLQYLKAGSAYRLELIPDHSELARPIEGVLDPRHLSIALRGIGVLTRSSEQAIKLEVGRTYECGIQQVGAAALIRGFYAPEPDLCWIAGLRGDIYFSLIGRISHPALLLDLRVRNSSNREHQQLTLTVNGTSLGSMSVPDGRHRLLLPLENVKILGYLHVVVGISHAEVTQDEDGRILDGRLLGCGLFAVGVVDASAYPNLIIQTAELAIKDGVST